MNLYERHPISADFPQLEGDRFQLLVESMRRRGYDPQEPITLYEGKILDGWNRQRAAAIVGIDPVYQDFDGNLMAAVDYSLDKNTARRQLTKGQEVYALLTVNAQLPEDRQLSDADIIRRTQASPTALSNARQTWIVAPDRAAAVGRGEEHVETVERQSGVRDTYKRNIESTGEKAFTLKTRLSKRFDNARSLHPTKLPPQSAINQAVELWASVCEAGHPVIVEITEEGKLGFPGS